MTFKNKIENLLEKYWLEYIIFWFGIGFVVSYGYFS